MRIAVLTVLLPNETAMTGDDTQRTIPDTMPRMTSLAKTTLLSENLVAISSSDMPYLLDLCASSIASAALKGRRIVI